jgi:predicted nuclease of restriction endonuclease-like (RecB) superfamily
MKKKRKIVSAPTAQIVSPPVRQLPEPSVESAFTEILHLIQSAKQRAYQAVNTELVSLYWQVGEYISRKLESAEWGDGVVDQLASFLARTQPGLRGFTRRNLFRMRQFYDCYSESQIVSPLVSQLPWTHHLLILSYSKREEEREFYLRMSIREKWGKRELERQLRAGLFAKAVLNPPKLSTALRELHPQAAEFFKDAYSLEFLGLADTHSEADLHGALLRNLGRFITELGRDFCFVGSEYPIQVGGQDFALDLLFFHRGLNCLVAIELKAARFEPEHLGKLNFYLEALDRDYRKLHENPAIGLLLCATKDSEVVEYALSRSLSPAMIAEYETQLPDKKLLRDKLHEFYQLLAPTEDDTPAKPKRKSKGATA